MSQPEPKTCDWCGELPLVKRGEEGHYLECSNLVDCPGWPYTDPLATEAMAVAAWNAITKQDVIGFVRNPDAEFPQVFLCTPVDSRKADWILNERPCGECRHFFIPESANKLGSCGKKMMNVLIHKPVSSPPGDCCFEAKPAR